METRAISPHMEMDFKSGVLAPLLWAVQEDDTLCLELRGRSAGIYYRGGSLFRIEDMDGEYTLSFDTNYITEGTGTLTAHPELAEAVENIPLYKQAMDRWFHQHPKYEREFQQLVLRENNNSGRMARSTDYYIIDIEYADGAEHARFDMVALKWPSNGASRKNLTRPSLAFIEVKYGDGALTGAAGLEKHVKDFGAFLGNREKLEKFTKGMEEVFRQKCRLGLIDGLQEKQYDITLSAEKPEVIFLLANHDPDSGILKNELTKIESGLKTGAYGIGKEDILFAGASGMGYGLYEPHMKDWDTFINSL